MSKRMTYFTFALVMVGLFALPDVAFCSVETTLTMMQSKLITTILPLMAILGLVIAGCSFVLGSPNAKNHLILAIFGAIIGFAAPSIIAFIRSVVQ